MFKLQFKDNPQRSIWLVGEKVSLGSDADNDLVLDGLGIDSRHAVIEIGAKSLILKSKAGSCTVNDLPVDAEYTLQANDELRIGKERLLIIDPQQGGPAQQKVVGEATRRSRNVWRLEPDHPKLKAQDFEIKGKEIIGRSKDCSFSVPYKLLSREHAELWQEDQQLFVKDLGSSNGCFVNDERVQEASLKPGDRLAFAKLAFTVKGPANLAGSKKTRKNPVVDASGEMNKTMVRPAINLEQELAASEEERALSGQFNALELEEDMDNEVVADSGGKGLWITLGLVLLAALGGAFWFLSQG